MLHKIKNAEILHISWPIFIEISLFMIMGMADTLMLSWYSDTSVAAVGMATQIFFLIGVLLSVVSGGAAIVLAQYLGAKLKKEGDQLALLAMLLNTLLGAFTFVVLYLGSSTFLTLINTPVEIFAESLLYAKIVSISMIPVAFSNSAGANLRTYGFTKLSMIIAIISNVINIIGNAILIFGLFGFPTLGSAGAALSTTLSRFLMAGLILFFFFYKTRIKFDLTVFRAIYKEGLLKTLKIGLPFGLEQLSYNLSQAVIISFVSLLGTSSITARIYTMNIVMFVYLLSAAIGQGTQIIIGKLVGSGEKEKAFKECLLYNYLSMIGTLIVALLFYYFRYDLLTVFTTDAQIIELSAKLFIFSVFMEPGRTLNIVLAAGARAAGDATFCLIVSILGMWLISVPLAYYLGIHMGLGLVGVWIACGLDEWIRGLALLARWYSKKWFTKSLITT